MFAHILRFGLTVCILGALLASPTFAQEKTISIPSRSPFIVRVLSLRCIASHNLEGDEVRLKVRADDEMSPILNRIMTTGEIWHVHRAFEFRSEALVRLFGEGMVDDEEAALGQVRVGPGAAGNPIVRAHFIEAHSARYLLMYQIVRR